MTTSQSTPVTPTAPAPAPASRISSLVVIVCMTVVVVGLLIAYVLLTTSHHDAGQLLTVLVAVLGAGIPGVAALSKTTEVGQAVSIVQHLTNGNMSRLITMAERVVSAQIDAAATAHETTQKVLDAVPVAHPADPVQGDAGPPPPPHPAP